MALNQQTYGYQTRPTEVKMRMLQANIANRKLKIDHQADRKDIFKLLLGYYLMDQKDQFVKVSGPDQKKSSSKHQSALLKFICHFRNLIAKKK